MRFCYWLALVAAMVCTPALVNAQEAATQEAAPNEQQAPEKPADQVAATEIMQLYRAGDVDAAEARFKEALEAHPNSMMLKNLHSVAYSALMRADRAAEALAH